MRDVIIIGAGPSGLSAAIAAKQRGLDYQVIEQGVLVNSIYHFPPQMVFFTTAELLEIGGLPFVTPYDKPTRAEALKYYRRVVDTFDLRIAFGETVLSVTREAEPADEAGERLFEVETRSARGVRRVRLARAVIFAIGYYDHPVRLGIPGEDLPHVRHYYGEPHPYYRQRVVIVGGGNSAAESALEMYRAGAHVTLVHRAPALKDTIKYWVRPDIENRIKEGSIEARFSTCITAIRPTSVLVTPAAQAAAGGVGTVEEIPADAVFLLTGYRADSGLMTRAGVGLNERQAPTVDPDTFETNVPGLFVAGGAIAGVDTGTVFIENGRFHGEKIIETLARRAGSLET
ncbi:MAG: YpdA family putative bacillithiol disulfide reductase [Acidobacteria bacterium]|nr:YpdA family putative bacillithiol disulfide reductase [Acidobacteriota bacterium]